MLRPQGTRPAAGSGQLRKTVRAQTGACRPLATSLTAQRTRASAKSSAPYPSQDAAAQQAAQNDAPRGVKTLIADDAREPSDKTTPSYPASDRNDNRVAAHEFPAGERGDNGAAAHSSLEDGAARQQLDPLSTFDELERSECELPPYIERENVPVDESVRVSYQSPSQHRRRPGNSIALAARNFVAETQGLIVAILEKVAEPEEPSIPEAFGFTLSNKAIAEFDAEHPPPGREPTPAFIRLAYNLLLYFVDDVYEDKAIERFWFLETVARMPYFAYSTCLHLYETLGWWRTGGLRVVHFAEEWNELHHLLIMEALGGDRRWQDRFLGQHAAIFYYWALVVCFLISPKWSYKFSEMLETHAVSTYRQFIVENGDKLKTLPAPKIAIEYYKSGDPYLFNMDSALARGANNEPPRLPPCENLYDVFVNIMEDEWEHVKTMVMCQDYDVMESLKTTQTDFAPSDGDTTTRRAVWNQWARDINDMDGMMELRKM